MHLIRQHIIDVHCSTQRLGKEIQTQLGILMHNDFYPKLQRLLDQYSASNRTWSIDDLTIELTQINAKNWKQEFVNNALAQIEAYLKAHAPVFSQRDSTESVHNQAWLTESQHAENLFFHFLKTGSLSENSMSQKLREILQAIDVGTQFLQRLFTEMASNPNALARWIFGVTEDFKHKVLQFVELPKALREFFQQLFQNRPVAFIQTSKIINSEWLELLQWFYVLQRESVASNSFSEIFVQTSEKHWGISPIELTAVFAFANSRQMENERAVLPTEMQLFLQRISAEWQVLHPESIVEKTTELQSGTEKGQYISNAGLVILHPFLPSLFEQVGLCENESWTTKTNQHKAVLLTQYLVTGQEEFFENELLLNKILCGFPVDAVINTQQQITEHEKAKCQSLLEAVNDYWRAMNGSSITALQQTFLQRNGKIALENDPFFELWVEEKGVDILLEQLPWGIGMFQTPWMQDYLNCYWD